MSDEPFEYDKVAGDALRAEVLLLTDLLARCQRQADEAEAENLRLREALERISEWAPAGGFSAKVVARAALGSVSSEEEQRETFGHTPLCAHWISRPGNEDDCICPAPLVEPPSPATIEAPADWFDTETRSKRSERKRTRVIGEEPNQ